MEGGRGPGFGCGWPKAERRIDARLDKVSASHVLTRPARPPPSLRAVDVLLNLMPGQEQATIKPTRRHRANMLHTLHTNLTHEPRETRYSLLGEHTYKHGSEMSVSQRQRRPQCCANSYLHHCHSESGHACIRLLAPALKPRQPITLHPYCPTPAVLHGI
jgi:hypothetical protein